MNKIVLTLALAWALTLIVGAVEPIAGAELSDAAKAVLTRAGVPVYPDARFCIGSPESGLRLATADAPAKVRAWYVSKLENWSLLNDEKMAVWVLYDGPPDVRGFAAAAAFNHLTIQANANLPEWHDLPAAMTTEIVIMASHEASPATNGALAVIPALEGWTAPDLPKHTVDEGFVGLLQHAQDMYSEAERYYFYLQDEDYSEHVLAYAEEIPEAVAKRLEAIADQGEPVRVLGELLIDELNGTSLFNRSQELRIVAVE